MLENRNILVFADDWGRYPSTMQHIGKVLAEKNRIIWVGSLGIRKPKFSLADIKRVFEKIRKIISGVNKTVSELAPVEEFYPFVIPYHDSKIIDKINAWLISRSINRRLAKACFEDYIVFTSFPVVDVFIDKLDYKSLYYFCLDDYSEFEGAFDSLLDKENKILSKVNAAFSVADVLVKSRMPLSGNSFFLPQGVNVEHFQRQNIKSSEVKPKSIGYFGMIGEWFDIETILEAARTYPDYKFEIIGKMTIEDTLLHTGKNITVSEPVPYSELPEKVAHFDVALIPFLINELTIAVNPLKLLEYFSMGMPVVSSAMPEVIKFKPNVYIGETKEEFVKLIQRAIDEDSEQKKSERLLIAKKYSWNSIAEYVSGKVIETEQNY